MIDAFLKGLKWYVIAFFTIIGIYALFYAESYDTPKPLLISVFTLGGAFVYASFWKDFRGKVLFAAFITLLLTGMASQYMPSILRVYFFVDISYSWLWLYCWWGVAFFAGVPFMAFCFKLFKD